MNFVTPAVSLLLLQLSAAGDVCQGFPGLPGRDSRDGKDGTPGVPGAAGLPGILEISYTTYEELKLISDRLNDPRLCCISVNTDNTCPHFLPTAASCKVIYDCNPNSPSGYYWRDSSPPEQMYCAMNLTRCGNTTGGWTRVARINMTSPEGTCPSPLETITSPRSCSRSGGAGCSSVNFSTFGVPFTQVCGRAIGYQYLSADAFGGLGMTIDDPYVDGLSITYDSAPRRHLWTYAVGHAEANSPFPVSTCPCAAAGLGMTIDDPYVDGLSITYDSAPRRHLWTYAVGHAESGLTNSANCPCAAASGVQPPSFVGDHYYCESGNVGGSEDQWYANDPLWDGDGCPSGNTCCDSPNLPWFNRMIDPPSTADIELRLCQDEDENEDVAVELFELYVY